MNEQQTMMSVEDFAGFFGNTVSTNQSTRKPTEGQIKYYNDLCLQNSVTPVDLTSKSYEEVSKMIGELRGMRSTESMSEKQKDKIVEVLERTPSIDINSLAPDWQSYDKTKASALIGQLFDLERQQRHLKPASQAQIEKIARMYPCPDVIFSDTGWEDDYVLYEDRALIKRPNYQQLIDWLAANMKQDKASEFITKYNPAYLTWARSRVSKEQVGMIRTLEARCANIRSAGAEQQQAVSSDGEVLIIEKAQRKEWSPIAYNALNEWELQLLSKDSASKYIEELQACLADKELVKFAKEEMNGDYLEEQRVGEGDAAVDLDIQRMSNFVHYLYSQLGEELTQEAQQVAQTPTKRMTSEVIRFLQNLVKHAVSNDVPLGGIIDALDDVPEVKVVIMG